MPHPHKAALDEYKFAIDHLVPTVPDEVKQEALERHEALLADEDADLDEIRKAMYETGMQEYPHRHAYHDLTDEKARSRMEELVMEHADESVRKKVKPHLDAGVSLPEFVKSDIFEQEFSAEERYQIEHGIMDAKDHVREHFENVDETERERYAELMKEHERRRDAILAKLDELAALKDKDAKWSEEIEGRLKRFLEGFLVTERDPELTAVEKEIEYWKGVLGEAQ